MITYRKYIRVDIFVLLFLISSFSSLLAQDVFVLIIWNFFICNNKPISKESSLYAVVWIGIYTQHIYFSHFPSSDNKLAILSSFSSKSQMPWAGPLLMIS